MEPKLIILQHLFLNKSFTQFEQQCTKVIFFQTNARLHWGDQN